MKILRLLAAAAMLGVCVCPAGAVASLSGARGVVQVRPEGAAVWELVVLTTGTRAFRDGDSVRTGAGASVEVSLGDGSTVILGANSEAALGGSTARPIVELIRGLLSASLPDWRRGAPRLQLAAGSVSSRANGTRLRVELGLSGRAVLEVLRGAVVVRDARGVELAVNGGERVRLDLRGAGAPEEEVAQPTQLELDRWRARARRELALDRAREDVLVSAARESRLSELRQGRAVIDDEGRRVRVEQFMMRPAGDTLRYVTLNARRDRFDAFALTGVFNRALPEDLSVPLADLPGRADAAPTFVMTSFTTLRTNGRDSLVEVAQGGHAVDLNANADPTDDVSTLFDFRLGRDVDVTGRGVFKTLYDRYGLFADGTLKRGWRGANVASYDPIEAVPSSASGVDPITGAPAAVFGFTSNETFPDPAERVVFESYGDGSSLRWEFRALDPDGRPAGTPGSLSFSRSENVTATEFQGRSIKLVMPQILPKAAELKP